MQVTETKSEGLIREFKIAVPAADIQEKTDNRLKELARTARLPGFRPGKVPVSLLRKRFGLAVRGEALEEIVKNATGNVLTERGLRATGQPRIEVTASDPEADFEYTMAVELLPEVTPPDYAAITLERLTVEPDDASVDEVLQRLTEGQKTAQPLAEPRPARSGDVAVIDFVGSVDGKEIAGGRAENYELELGAGLFIPGFEDQLVGAEAGEERQITVNFPAEYGATELAGKAAVFQVSVKEIKEMAPAVLDDALAKRFGKETLAELRQDVVDNHRNELRTMSRMVLKRSLLDRLAELYEFDVPPSMVSAEYDSIVRQIAADKKASEEAPDAGAVDAHEHEHEHEHEHGHDHVHDHDHDHDHHHGHTHDHDHEHSDVPNDSVLTDEEKAEYRELAERRVRLGLVLAEVGRANQLQVTPEELKRALYAEAGKYPGHEREFLELYDKYPQAAEALAGPILEEKVVDFMLEMATVTERPVGIDELREALKAERADDDEAPAAAEGDVSKSA